ncbi:hypothetical protein FACS1894214_5010 [Planctomycetales bacterium]|nr:hypothetical protein FACS1894214_5010 [Planctomycetales bacterium]
MITDLRLTDISGDFSLDTKSVNIEWLVESDNLFDFAVAIAVQGTVASGNMISGGKAVGWLAPGKPYQLGNDIWNTCYAESVQISNRRIIGDRVLWEASQKFSTKADEEKDGGEPSTEDKFTLKTGTEFEEAPFYRDARTNKLILNSAKQFFNPLPTAKRKIRTYSLTRREKGNPVAKSNAYSNVVNSDNFYGAGPGTVLMDSISCDFDGEAWSVTYNIKERLDTWATFILDTGYAELDANGKPKKILDAEGTPISEPAKLDGSGHKLPTSNDTGYDIGPLWKYEQKPFSTLNIPNFYNVMTHQ